MTAVIAPLRPLIDFFEAILRAFHSTGLGWGSSIIALTLVIRAALLPLTLRQFKSMQRLAHLQPQMKTLQQRYKDDKERLNQEMMRFYRENKVNPFASCLPMVAQIPVFISLFYMLRTDLRHDICPEINPPGVPNPQPCGDGGEASFWFIPDLTNQAHGWVLAVLIVLYVGSQLLSTLLMSTTTDKTQRRLFLALPFFFVLFVFRFPAGLLVYWITTNLWTIVQQAIVRKRLGPMRPPDADDSGGLSALFKPKSTAPTPTPALAGSTRASGGRAASGGGATGGGSEPKGRASGPPPPSPRKKKKRSGRRR